VTNRLCSLFGIDVPVIMGGVSRFADLGVAISNAGGLGCMQGVSPMDMLREQIRRFRDATDRPFSINFPIVLTPADQIEPKMRLMVEERVPVVITSAGNPKLWTSYLKENGIRVAHVVPTLYHARKAVEGGVDAVIAEPAESGGYRGEHEVSMMVLIPAIRRAFPELPLAAAGAVADGAGMAAVMALGADGVQLGTRFIATLEANSPEPVRKLILAATDTSTMSAEGRVKPRVGKPEFAQEILGEKRQVQMGQVAALIDEIIPVDAVMRELVEGGLRAAERARESLAELGAVRA
jgi:enoyl-[acyl-carrier protein] reductase II